MDTNTENQKSSIQIDETLSELTSQIEMITAEVTVLLNKRSALTAEYFKLKRFISERNNDIEPINIPNISAHWVKCDYKRLDDAGEVQTYIGQGVYCSNCRTGRHKNEVKGWVCCPNCGATIKNTIKSEGDVNE